MKILAFLFLLLVAILNTRTSIAQKQGQALLDSLLSQLKEAKEDTNQVNLMNILSEKYIVTDPDKGISYGTRALSLAEKLNWNKGKANANLWIGINYFYGKTIPSKALEYYSNASDIFEDLGDQTGLARVAANKATIYTFLSDYPKALEYHFKALKAFEGLKNKKGIGTVTHNIGLTYNALVEYDKALEYMFKALKIMEDVGDPRLITGNMEDIGVVYKNKGDYAKAFDYMSKAFKMSEESGDNDETATIYNNIGNVYEEQKDYFNALKYYSKSLKMSEKSGKKSVIAANLHRIGAIYAMIATDSNRTNLNKLFKGNKIRALRLSRENILNAIVIIKELGNLSHLSDCFKDLSEIQASFKDFKGALDYYKEYSTLKDSVYNLEKDKKITQTVMEYEFEKKVATSKSMQEKKEIKQRILRYFMIAGIVLLLIFLTIFYRLRVKTIKEKKKSDVLLLNILPTEIAEELKKTGTIKAKAYTMVTVMFMDFKDFTRVSEMESAEMLVAEIHYCFSAFDNIIERHNVEKIKTIGDAYLCASGLPISNYTHAEDMLRAAFEFRNFMLDRKKEKETKGEIPFEIRIGIHTGPVVAGIVGVKKYAYDIWGDTVNVAARMEQNSETSKINISSTTYQLVKDKFNCTHRGKIAVKNKGSIDMYFVENV